jgi:hypothetical protein
MSRDTCERCPATSQVERVTGIEPPQSAWLAGDRRARSRARYRTEPAGVCFTWTLMLCAKVCATAVRSRPSAAVRGHPHVQVELRIRTTTHDRGARARGLSVAGQAGRGGDGSPALSMADVRPKAPGENPRWPRFSVRASHPAMTLGDIVTLSTRAVGDARAVFVQVRTVVLDHHFDHHCTRFAPVRCGPPPFRMPPDLRRRTSTNCREPAADGWGARGHRFEPVSPTVEPQVRGGSAEDAGPPLA